MALKACKFCPRWRSSIRRSKRKNIRFKYTSYRKSYLNRCGGLWPPHLQRGAAAVAFSVGCVLESDICSFASSDQSSNFPSLARALKYLFILCLTPLRFFFPRIFIFHFYFSELSFYRLVLFRIVLFQMFLFHISLLRVPFSDVTCFRCFLFRNALFRIVMFHIVPFHNCICSGSLFPDFFFFRYQEVTYMSRDSLCYKYFIS